MAKICVEIDLLKPKVEEFWIGIRAEKQLQRVVFEKFLKYCVDCLHLGHSADERYANGNKPKPEWKVGRRNNGVAGEDLREVINRKRNSGNEKGNGAGPSELKSDHFSKESENQVWIQKTVSLKGKEEELGLMEEEVNQDFLQAIVDDQSDKDRKVDLQEKEAAVVDDQQIVQVASEIVKRNEDVAGKKEVDAVQKSNYEKSVMEEEDVDKQLKEKRDPSKQERKIAKDMTVGSIQIASGTLAERRGLQILTEKQRAVEGSAAVDRFSEVPAKLWGDPSSAEFQVDSEDDVVSKSFVEEDDSEWDVSVLMRKRKIWFAYDSNIDCLVLMDHDQFLHLKLSSPILPIGMYVMIVYAKCTSTERMVLWERLLEIKLSSDEFWLVGGDFNVITSPHEHSARILSKLGAVSEFNNFLMMAGLLDAGFVGDRFTWTNNKIWKQLDRIMVSPSWNAQNFSVRVEHFSRAASDHCPLLLSFPGFTKPIPCFRFQKMWIKHHNFLITVRLNWMLPYYGNGLQKLQLKLKRLKAHLKWWNADVFGNVHENVMKVEEQFASAERAFDSLPTVENKIYMAKWHASLFQTLHMEEQLKKKKGNPVHGAPAM
ncbi:uncharacterized protein LOC122013892 [Zingiber officinale]|uniref:uncharacterized protein LOC122013892 n=1 Tax=Zingiber officinale TaxID=94328 RepID=UPI001C4B38DE|nr:uncharacterized protein LOC122013892 [Zingiber officinale]